MAEQNSERFYDNPYLFNGKEIDAETGNYYYGARYYDPRLSIFLSVDPLVEKTMQPYSYANNNPIRFIDPDGMEPIPWIRRFFITLRKSDWWQYDSLSGWYDKETFSSAAMYNTQHLNTKAYKTIYYRSQYYKWAQSKLDETSSKWFEAAHSVTTLYGVGAADNINLGVIYDSTERMMREGNAYLFTNGNMSNAKEMINNKKGSFTDGNGNVVSFDGLKGIELDFALVKFEQTKVQEFLMHYQKNNNISDSQMNAMTNQISSAMSSFSTGDMSSAMKDLFNDGKDFNFGNYFHRVKLGNYLIKKLHENDKK